MTPLTHKDMKILKAKLKEEITVAVELSDMDFTKDWLSGVHIIEEQKKKLFWKLKNDLHEKIAMLSMEDVLFKIEP